MEVHCHQAQPKPFRPRRTAQTVLYQVVQGHLETVLAAQGDGTSAIPAHAERALRRYLECGILAHGFARARCGDCGHDFLITFSCKGCGVCPSCNTRRMAETAAHLVDHVLPPVAMRQWVLSLPKRLRWHLHHQPGALDTALRILLDAIERDLRTRCDAAATNARGGAVAFIHRFGSALNAHTHFHVCAIADADRRGRERLLRYCARPPFAGERLEWIDADRVRYRLPKPRPDGCTELILSPPQLIERVAALVPPPRRHRLRYYGVLAPNAALRPAVTALAPEQDAEASALGPAALNGALSPAADEADPAHKDNSRKARYLWAVLLARIYEAFPLTCPQCAGEMRIIAFVTAPASIQAILAHIGEPIRPPRPAPARDPPAWGSDGDAREVMDPQAEPVGIDPLAQPEPDYIFDQRIAW